MAERDLLWPPKVLSSLVPESNVDKLGRRQPRRMTVLTFLRALPIPESASRQVPEEYWAHDVNEDGYSEAIVSCPCGDMPHVELGSVAECACERVFLFAGTEVRVFNHQATRPESLGPADPSQVPEPPSEDPS